MPSTLERPAIRWAFFLAVLLAEIIALTTRYEVPDTLLPREGDTINFAKWMFDLSKNYWQATLWVIGSCMMILTPHYKTILGEFATHLQGYRWSVWLTLHLLTFAAFVVVTDLIFEKPTNPGHLTASWFSVWFSLAGTTFILWLLALAPSKFWLWLTHEKRQYLLVGILVGICIWVLVEMLVEQKEPLPQKELWFFLSGYTLQLVYRILVWFYSDLVYQPEALVVGTTTFPVEIGHFCSGIEGILLICFFLAIYIWLFKKDLRFPQIFWLFPLGMLAIWLANAVRIAMLIVIGTSFSHEIAERGFHMEAGWIAFVLIAIGAITISHRMKFFSANSNQNIAFSGFNSLATALLVPLLVQMAALMVTSALSSGFDWLYPLRIVIVIASLCYFRAIYTKLDWKWTWQSPMIGVAVFIAWMALEPNSQGGGVTLLQSLEKMPWGWAIVWLVSRAFGSVIVVPLVEEFAFRGYLIRKLIANDFENVPAGSFTWISFIISSLLFGLLHDRWLAGTLAGMGYAIALYRRGHLGDAVVAHMTTNALIAVVVLTQGRWGLWG